VEDYKELVFTLLDNLEDNFTNALDAEMRVNMNLTMTCMTATDLKRIIPVTDFQRPK